MVKDTLQKKNKIILELKNVSFSFDNTIVLKNISLDIVTGDFVGLIGPNGSGKTTLLKIILKILPRQSGTIKINKISLDKFNDWARIGYVPQKATSIETQFPATVSEVVAMGLLSTKKFPKLITKNDNEKIINALQLVKMTEFKNRRIGELSGGQQQRILIAKAMISEPEILFLDEPTTGVDQESQKNFYELLGKLNTEGTTIVLVSHDVGKITRYVTKIASLNQHLEFYGTHKEFCANDQKHKHDYHSHNLCLDRG
ncbi:MAG: metal ABC transporter ATP-binding protein [archaeon]